MHDWAEFNEISVKAGLFHLQITLTKMCEINLGLPDSKDIEWCHDAEDEICEKLMHYVCKMGNYGASVEEFGSFGKFTLLGNVPSCLRQLQKGGLARWKATQKHKMLRPFAWLYQGIRICKSLMARKEPIKKLRRDMEITKETLELMNALGLKKRIM